MSVETGDDADLGAPVWASFGDLMSVRTIAIPGALAQIAVATVLGATVVDTDLIAHELEVGGGGSPGPIENDARSFPTVPEIRVLFGPLILFG